jgi:putative endonuclease
MGLPQCIGAALAQCRSWLSIFPNPSEKDLLKESGALGREGERLAARFLQKSGHKILYRNYKPVHGGEVDLVCRVRRSLELVFVEVKTRSSEAYGAPQNAVDWRKQQRIVRAAQEWMEQLHVEGVTARFDVVEVILTKGQPELRHIQNAFTAEETRHPGSAPLIPGANRGDVLPKRGRGGAAQTRRRPPRG